MKKLLVIGSVALVLGLLIVGSTTAILAHSPDDNGATSDNYGAWEAMHEACESGDWQAMDEAAREVHGEDFNHMPCHDENDYTAANYQGSMGDHMGRGMMGW